MAENIYRNLVPEFFKDAPISVHLCSFPIADEKAIDVKLEEGMQKVLDIVVLGRACRNVSNIKNRQPLQKIFVSSDKIAGLSQDLLSIAKDELNIKDIEYCDDVSRFVSYKIKPQLKTLGPKYGSKLGQIRKFFDNCNAKSLVETVKAGNIYRAEFEGDVFEFDQNDLLIETVSEKGFVSSSDKGVTVVMDTNVTEQLLDEGVERELISKIQSMRKEAGFEVVDRISVSFVSDNARIKKAFASGKDLKTVILADSVAEGKGEGFEKELDVNGEKVTVYISKI